MEEEILRLIYNYSTSGKNADKKFIEQLINLVSSCKELNNYITKLCFYRKSIDEKAKTMRLADYNFINKDISVNIIALSKYVEMYLKHYGQYFSDLEQLFYGNLLTSQVILHELEHVAQNKKYNSSLNDTETSLIKMERRNCFMLENPDEFFYILKQKGYSDKQIYVLINNRISLYQKYYKYNPIERLAEIRSYNTLTAAISGISEKIPNLYDYEYYYYLRNLLSGYEVMSDESIMPPTITYINGMEYQQDLPKFDFYDEDQKVMNDKLFRQYSFLERSSFGLSLTKEEHNAVNKQLIKYNRFK